MTDVPSAFLPESLSIALVVLFSLALAGLAMGAVIKTLRERRLAIEAASHRSPRVLVPGACTLRGIVRGSRGGPPIQMQIGLRGAQWRDQQRYREPGTGPLRDLWWETKREVKARPFEVVLASGVRVRVLASDDVQLIAPLVERGPYAPTQRTVGATLCEGTEVWIDGALARGEIDARQPYRDHHDAWSITAPSRGRLTVSTVPPALRHGRRANHWQSVAITAGLALVITQACLAISFWPLVIHGVRCEAEIDTLREDMAVTHASGSRARHSVHAQITACEGEGVLVGTRVSDEIPLAAWRSLTRGDRVPFFVSSTDARTAVIGDHAGLSSPAALMLLLAGAIGALAVLVTHRRSLDWYWQRSGGDEGAGPL